MNKNKTNFELFEAYTNAKGSDKIMLKLSDMK